MTTKPASAHPGPQVHKFASLLSQADSKPQRISLPPGMAAPDGLHCPPPTRLFTARSGGWETRWGHSGSCCTEVAARPWSSPHGLFMLLQRLGAACSLQGAALLTLFRDLP